MKYLAWIDKLPWPMLIVGSLLLGIAPYPAQPQPHLVEKLGMLAQGTLARPIDIFDLLLHGTLPLLLLAKLGYTLWAKRPDAGRAE